MRDRSGDATVERELAPGVAHPRARDRCDQAVKWLEELHVRDAVEVVGVIPRHAVVLRVPARRVERATGVVVDRRVDVDPAAGVVARERLRGSDQPCSRSRAVTGGSASLVNGFSKTCTLRDVFSTGAIASQGHRRVG